MSIQIRIKTSTCQQFTRFNETIRISWHGTRKPSIWQHWIGKESFHRMGKKKYADRPTPYTYLFILILFIFFGYWGKKKIKNSLHYGKKTHVCTFNYVNFKMQIFSLIEQSLNYECLLDGFVKGNARSLAIKKMQNENLKKKGRSPSFLR